jgi:L-glyceraldehyde reductase
VEHIRGGLQQTLKDLQTDYLDLYLIHWPIAYEFTGYDLATSEVFPKDAQGRPRFAKAPTHHTWKELETVRT